MPTHMPIKNDAIMLPALPSTIMPGINQLVASLGIPRDVLASDEEIQYAWQNLPREIKDIPNDIRGELIARMCVAVSTGLFDGAINYIWNASILKLREDIRQFGLPVVRQILQKKFEEKDLLDLQDSQLLDLCLKLNLISEDGFFFLGQCRSIRNNFSAAHPTMGKINDREFTTFLNRCVKYALSNTGIPRGVEIPAFITAIKASRYTDGQCMEWVERIRSTHEAQRELLFGTVHGIYCDPTSQEHARLNSLDLCNLYKGEMSSNILSEFINRHSEYLAQGDDIRHTMSQQLFEKLELVNLLNESEQHNIFSKAINHLWITHQGMNNFYNEPPFAERLLTLSKNTSIPNTVKENFVRVVAGCYIGNGFGVSHAAEDYYVAMIRNFTPKEIGELIKLPGSNTTVSRLINSDQGCKSRYKKALQLIDENSIPNSLENDFRAWLS